MDLNCDGTWITKLIFPVLSLPNCPLGNFYAKIHEELNQKHMKMLCHVVKSTTKMLPKIKINETRNLLPNWNSNRSCPFFCHVPYIGSISFALPPHCPELIKPMGVFILSMFNDDKWVFIPRSVIRAHRNALFIHPWFSPFCVDRDKKIEGRMARITFHAGGSQTWNAVPLTIGTYIGKGLHSGLATSCFDSAA